MRKGLGRHNYQSAGSPVSSLILDDEDIEPLRPYMVYPTDPIRVWA